MFDCFEICLLMHGSKRNYVLLPSDQSFSHWTAWSKLFRQQLSLYSLPQLWIIILHWKLCHSLSKILITCTIFATSAHTVKLRCRPCIIRHCCRWQSSSNLLWGYSMRVLLFSSECSFNFSLMIVKVWKAHLIIGHIAIDIVLHFVFELFILSYWVSIPERVLMYVFCFLYRAKIKNKLLLANKGLERWLCIVKLVVYHTPSNSLKVILAAGPKRHMNLP